MASRYLKIVSQVDNNSLKIVAESSEIILRTPIESFSSKHAFLDVSKCK